MTLGLVLGGLAAILTAAGVMVAYLQLRRMPRKGSDASPITSLSDVSAQMSRSAVRHNLPQREHLIGRNDERKRLLDGLHSPYPIVSLEGLGGMGKTALAKEAAWACVDRGTPFKAIVWCQDTDGSLTLSEIQDLISDVLEFPYTKSLPAQQKQRETILLLQDIATLVIIDNLDTVSQADVLSFIEKVPEPPSKVLITTRVKNIPSAWAISVTGLPQQDGIAVIQSEAQRIGLTIADDAYTLRALYEATGGNPLAMRLTIGQIKVEGISVNDILKELTTAEGSELFRAIFHRSWGKILQTDEYARRVLMTLSLIPASASRAALQAGSDIHGPYLRSAISRLIELSLIDSIDSVTAEPRYELHTLTRAFVRRELAAETAIRGELQKRLIDYFRKFAMSNSETYKDATNVERLESERIGLLAFADLAYQLAAETKNEQDWKCVISYANSLSSYLWGRGFWSDHIQLCQHAVVAAEATGDKKAMAAQLVLIGRVYLWRRDFAAAREYLIKSEEALKSCADQVARVASWKLRAQIASGEGNYDLAKSLLLDILTLAPLTVDDDGRAATLIELGLVAQREAKFAEARSRFEEALRLDEDLGTLEGQAVSLSHLGEVLLALHLESAAQSAFERGLGLAESVQRLSAIGRCEIGLARLFTLRGDIERASVFATSAEMTFQKLGMHDLADQARSLSIV